jgi:ribosomal protein L22
MAERRQDDKKQSASKAKAKEQPKGAPNETTSQEKRTTPESKPKRAARAPARSKARPEPKAQKSDTKSQKADTEAAGKARPRRAARKPAERERPAPPRPVVRAQAKYVRSSARKARLVIEHIRGRSIEDARAVLRHTPRGVARDLERLLNSAVANAENNHELVGDDLVIKEAYADEGPTIKRFRPRALGRATRIRKRTSHLTVTLTPKE